MVFPLAKVYERRLEHNVRRHRMDAHIAPRKPQPNCSPAIFQSAGAHRAEPAAQADPILLERFIRDAAETAVSAARPPPPLVRAEPVLIEQAAKECGPQPDLAKQGMQRAGSVESAIFTGSDCSSLEV